MLLGKTAIITGATGGIGKATVEAFAKNRASAIWACDYSETVVGKQFFDRIATQYNVNIYPLYFDITNEAEIKRSLEIVKRSTPKVDILVNVAGIVADNSSFAMCSQQKMRNVFEVNFFALSLLTQYVVRIMQRHKEGNIINIASVAALDGRPGQYEYASSKAAVVGATKELARELWQFGIRVNAIAPGMINTTMGAKIDEKLRNIVLSQTTMGRLGRPEEIANVIAFLGSELSSYMTGQIIRVDGGM